MINFIKFLFGARVPHPIALTLATEAVGGAMYEKVCEVHPELKEMNKTQTATYLGNAWLQEQTQEIFAGRYKQLLEAQDKIAAELTKVLK